MDRASISPQRLVGNAAVLERLIALAVLSTVINPSGARAEAITRDGRMPQTGGTAILRRLSSR